MRKAALTQVEMSKGRKETHPGLLGLISQPLQNANGLSEVVQSCNLPASTAALSLA